MTSPIVLITRDRNEQAVFLGFCEDEAAYYWSGSAIVLNFDTDHNLWWGKTLRQTEPVVRFEASLAMWRLTRNPWTDVSDQVTHEIAEPGAPLEPIPGRAA